MLSIDEMPAGREMDLLIDRELFGKKNLRAYHKIFTGRHIDSDRKLTPYQQSELDAGNYGPWEQCPAPYYSTDIAAAWEVRKAIQLLGFDVVNVHTTPNNPYCQFIKSAGVDSIEQYIAYAETDALAICRAALKAVMKGVK
jgi:hypothetical protein